MKKLLITLVLIFGITASAHAALITLSNVSYDSGLYPSSILYHIYNSAYGTAYTTNSQLEALENNLAISNGLFQSNSGTVAKVARYSAGTGELGYFQGAIETKILDILPGFTTLSRPYTALSVTSSGEFGFYGDSELGKWYSQKGLNSDGRYHFIVLNAPAAYPNTLLVGFEDMTQGDWDYNDYVVELVNIIPTPEPTSMLLFGMGILGLFGFRKRT